MADVSFTFSGDATSLQKALNEIKQELGKTKEAVSTLAGRCAMAFTAIQGGINAVKSAFSALGSISSAAANVEQLVEYIPDDALATLFQALYKEVSYNAAAQELNIVKYSA